jgi:hypothetical protein
MENEFKITSQTPISINGGNLLITSFQRDEIIIQVNQKMVCFMLHLNKEDFKKIAYEMNELRYGLP